MYLICKTVSMAGWAYWHKSTRLLLSAQKNASHTKRHATQSPTANAPWTATRTLSELIKNTEAPWEIEQCTSLSEGCFTCTEGMPIKNRKEKEERHGQQQNYIRTTPPSPLCLMSTPAFYYRDQSRRFHHNGRIQARWRGWLVLRRPLNIINRFLFSSGPPLRSAMQPRGLAALMDPSRERCFSDESDTAGLRERMSLITGCLLFPPEVRTLWTNLYICSLWGNIRFLTSANFSLYNLGRKLNCVTRGYINSFFTLFRIERSI